MPRGMSLWSVRFVVATLSLLTACADDEVLDAPELLDASADPEREVQSFVLPSRRDVSESRFELVEAFPSLTFEDPVAMVEADGRLYVVERPGRIYSFVPDEDVSEKTLVLDLSDHSINTWDSGTLAIAMHPRFGETGAAERGDFYVYYAHGTPWTEEGRPTSRTTNHLRLSRFTIPDGETVADASSEQVLIDQLDRSLTHQGGGLLFNPRDGFLYLSVGDEGGMDCTFDNCQRIDRSLFGGVLRIDVDQRGGDVSHAIRRQPDDGVTDHYFIPNDNPFVDDPDVLEEFYAIGLRNPYRMTYDAVDDQTWIGDVGQGQREEIDVLHRNANYQWDVMEGDVTAPMTRDPTRVRLGDWRGPVITYERAEMRAIVGGYVYRGDALPMLYGRYLHADFVDGGIWAARYEVIDGEVNVLDSELLIDTDYWDADDGITSFALDSRGAMYVLTLGDESKIMRFEEAPQIAENAPRLLSQTGLFEDLESLTPAPGLNAYEVIAPLWSDGTRKQRFFAVPPEESARFTRTGAWDLPEGAVLVKHFAVALDEREDARDAPLHNLETRVLVLGEQGVYGATYKWRDDQRDAELLLEHAEEELEIVDADGARMQTHVYPSPSECLRCHVPAAGDALGIETAQLNREVDGENQLTALASLGVLTGMRADADVDTLPRRAAIDDQDAPLELRVRSYLDANCSFCHGTREISRARWDARIETALQDANILDGEVVGLEGSGDQRIIAPGDPAHSALLLRASSTDPNVRMPPLGSRRADEAFLAVLREWIRELE